MSGITDRGRSDQWSLLKSDYESEIRFRGRCGVKAPWLGGWVVVGFKFIVGGYLTQRVG